MYQQAIKSEKNRSFIKCSICKQEIIGKHRFIELAMNYGVICPECDKNFNDEEIELISNLFTAFGGYFGSRKGKSEISKNQIMKKLLNLYKECDKKIDINALDIKILHQALLHGISPSQIVQGF
jgi:hypothetical protein